MNMILREKIAYELFCNITECPDAFMLENEHSVYICISIQRQTIIEEGKKFP